MKKRLLAALLGTIGLVLFFSCEKDDNDGVDNTSYFANINSGQWSSMSGIAYYDVAVDDLTQYYLQEGFVSTAISFDGEASYQILPATFEGISYSVEYAPGRVTVYAENATSRNRLDNIPQGKLKIILSDVDYANDL